MKKRLGWLAVGLLAAWPVNTFLAMNGGYTDAACLVLVCLFVLAAGVLCAKKRLTGADMLLAGGFVLGFVFVLKFPHNFSWHDLAAYAPFTEADKPDGHLGYIAWIVENHALPLVNPMEEGYSVFYNPPLYHIVQAVWMKANLALGIAQEAALENLQLFTLACMSGCHMTTVELLRELGADKKGLRTGALAIACQPILLILGATLNNDILSILCMMLAILFTVRWIRTRAMRDILGAAISLGAGMATKLSTALLIPCMGLVFAVAFFQNLKDWKRYAGQFGAFLALSVPEAVAWPLYHLIAFWMPLNYVRLPAATLDVGHMTLWQRYGVPDWFAIRSLFYSSVRKKDHNVWMQTLKTGLFDEQTLFAEGTWQWYAAYLTLVLFAAALLISLVLFVRFLLSKRQSGLTRGFLGVYGAVLIAYYLKFTLDYPYMCTFNFRYIAPVLMLCALALGLYRSEGRKTLWIEAAAALFAAMVVLLYGMFFFV